MVRSTEEKLLQERANLWRAKNLSRHFMGDESWMPLESTEGPDHWDMVEPKPRTPAQQAGKKRKRGFENEMPHNGINGHETLESTDNQDAANAESINLET